MKCSQCGQALDSTDKLCSNCGKAVAPVRKRAQVFPRGFEMICLMTGVALTSDIRKELYKIACDMGQKGCEKMAVTHPDFEGTITTDFSYCAFNNLGGVKFTAEIEGNNTKGKVIFLVTNFEYTEDGIWLPVVPLPPSHPASKAQYN